MGAGPTYTTTLWATAVVAGPTHPPQSWGQRLWGQDWSAHHNCEENACGGTTTRVARGTHHGSDDDGNGRGEFTRTAMVMAGVGAHVTMVAGAPFLKKIT